MPSKFIKYDMQPLVFIIAGPNGAGNQLYYGFYWKSVKHEIAEKIKDFYDLGLICL
jgi:hypothetical protein